MYCKICGSKLTEGNFCKRCNKELGSSDISRNPVPISVDTNTNKNNEIILAHTEQTIVSETTQQPVLNNVTEQISVSYNEDTKMLPNKDEQVISDLSSVSSVSKKSDKSILPKVFLTITMLLIIVVLFLYIFKDSLGIDLPIINNSDTTYVEDLATDSNVIISSEYYLTETTNE